MRFPALAALSAALICLPLSVAVAQHKAPAPSQPGATRQIQRVVPMDSTGGTGVGIPNFPPSQDTVPGIDSAAVAGAGNTGLRFPSMVDTVTGVPTDTLAPRPTPPPAQTVVCAPTAPRQSPAALQLFSATYTLASAVSMDTSNVGALGGFDSITIPGTIGIDGASAPRVLPNGFPSFWNGYTANERDHTNLLWLGAEPIKVKWSQNTSVAKSNVSALLREATTAGWCISTQSTDSVPFYLRMGVQLDWRWESNGFLSGVVGGIVGSEWNQRHYIGIHVYPWIRQGTGFPVQWYSIAPPSQWGDSAVMATWAVRGKQAADALFQANDASQKEAMSFSTYDLEMFGSIDSAYAITLPRVCTREGGLGGLFGGRHCTGPKQSIAIARSLVGEIRRRSYRDPRIGLPHDSSMSAEARITIRMSAPVWTSYNDNDVNAMMALVRQACGTRRSCGPTRFPPSVGTVTIPGSDDSLRTAEMCRRATGLDCLSDSTAAGRASVASAAQIDSATNGTRSNVNLSITDSQVVSTLDGMAGGMRMGPQAVERRCLEQAQMDSASIANGPVAVGDSTSPSQATAAAAAACVAAGGPPGQSGTGAGGYSVGGPPPLSSPATGAVQPGPMAAARAGAAVRPAPVAGLACQMVNGRRYCVQVGRGQGPRTGH